MNNKKNVLLVTNSITQEEVSQIKTVIHDHKPSQIKLSLVHIIPAPPTCYFNIPSMGLLIGKYYDEAKDSLTHIGKHLSIPKKDQWLISGKIRTEALRLANKLNSHFILASTEQIQELQHSLFFKNIRQYALIKDINHLKQL